MTQIFTPGETYLRTLSTIASSNIGFFAWKPLASSGFAKT